MNNDAMPTEPMMFELGEAQLELDQFIRALESNSIEWQDDTDLAHEFKFILEHLCRAWHFRKVNSIQDLKSASVSKAATLIPNWGLFFEFDASCSAELP